MKKNILLLITLLLLSCQNNKEEKQIILSGKIENPNSDSLLVKDQNRNTLHTITLKNDGTFIDTLSLTKGFYILFDKVEQTYVYLKPGYNLNITLDTKGFDETIKFSGIGEAENNYLAKKSLLTESFGKLRSYGYYAALDEKDFLKLTDSLHNEIMALYNKNNYDKDFAYQETNTLKYDRLNQIGSYERMRKFVMNDRNFKVSDKFPNVYEDIDLSNKKLVDNSAYIRYVESYLNTIHIKENSKNEDRLIAYFNIVDSLLQNHRIKEKIAYKNGVMYLTYAKDLDSFYNKITSMIKNESHKKELKEKYDKLKLVSKGAVSPTFKFQDINEEYVSLADLKGKLVYIDIWATWCGPCKAEIPHLKKLEEEFRNKDIYFVSISKNDSKEKWQQMVKEKNLKGIQLFAENSETFFF